MLYKIAPQIRWRRVGREVVILGLNAEYFTLADAGASVWEWICEGIDKAGIAARLTEHYRVSAAKARGDVSGILQKLVKSDLVVPTNSASRKKGKHSPPPGKMPYTKFSLQRFSDLQQPQVAMAAY